MAFYRGSVGEIGNLIGIQKGEVEFTDKNKKELITLYNYFRNPNKIDKHKNLISKWKEYNKKDSYILMKFLLDLKRKCKENKISCKKLFSSGQLAINKVLNILAESPEYRSLFDDKRKRILIKHNREVSNKIHLAYRGARNQVFQLGKFENTLYLDINSSYGYCLANIEIPNLRSLCVTEFSKYHKFEEIDKQMYLNNIINKIGITRLVLYKKERMNIGIVPIRFEKHNVFPNNDNQIIIGSYTNLEIREFVKEGYEILHIFEEIYYNVNIKENPLKELFYKWYEERKKSALDKYFYKNLITNSVGKFGERRFEKIIQIDNVNKQNEYLKEGYEIKNIYSTDCYVYEKKQKEYIPKYYCPIISAYVTAQARLNLYKIMKQINNQDLIQTNTDSILFKNNKYLELFDVKDELGCWKIVDLSGKGIVYAKNTYSYNNELKLSGISKKESKQQLDKFNNAKEIEYTKFNSILNNNKKEFVSRSLRGSMQLEEELNNKIEQTHFFVDEKEGTQSLLDWIIQNTERINELKGK